MTKTVVELGSKRRQRKQANSGRDEYNTPLAPLIALEPMTEGGIFGLDPCWNERSLVAARVTLTEEQNGLAWDWYELAKGELAFVNPPYGEPLRRAWGDKMVDEAAKGLEMVSLVPASPETAWYRKLEDSAAASCIPPGRLVFGGMTQGAFFGSTFFYHGERPQLFERCMLITGHIRALRPFDRLTPAERTKAWQEGINRRLAHHPAIDRATLMERIKVAIDRHNAKTGFDAIPEQSQKGLSWRKLYRIACG